MNIFRMNTSRGACSYKQLNKQKKEKSFIQVMKKPLLAHYYNTAKVISLNIPAC